MARVLIVEDEPEIRSLWRDFLELEGHAGQFAETAGEARALLGAGFDVAFVDWILPDGPAGPLVAEILAASPACRVIVVSGLTPRAPAGVAGMLPKPFTLAEARRWLSG